MAASMQKISRKPTDKWSVKEKLALASAVLRCGDNNWASVSRLIRPLAEPSRPSDWCSQKNAALQYSELMENLEIPKRKRGEKVDKNNSPANLIYRKLRIQRIEELQKLIQEGQQRCREKQDILTKLEKGELDGQLPQIVQHVKEIERQKHEADQAHQSWMQEREAKFYRKPKMPTSPLLTSLLTNSNPTLSKLLEMPLEGGREVQEVEIKNDEATLLTLGIITEAPPSSSSVLPSSPAPFTKPEVAKPLMKLEEEPAPENPTILEMVQPVNVNVEVDNMNKAAPPYEKLPNVEFPSSQLPSLSQPAAQLSPKKENENRPVSFLNQEEILKVPQPAEIKEKLHPSKIDLPKVDTIVELKCVSPGREETVFKDAKPVIEESEPVVEEELIKEPRSVVEEEPIVVDPRLVVGELWPVIEEEPLDEEHRSVQEEINVEVPKPVEEGLVVGAPKPFIEKDSGVKEPKQFVKKKLILDESQLIVEKKPLVKESGKIVEHELLVREPEAVVEQKLLVKEPEAVVEQKLLVKESEAVVEQKLFVEEPETGVEQKLLVKEPEAVVEQKLLVEEHEAVVEQKVLVKEPQAVVEQKPLVKEPEAVVEQKLLANEPEAVVEQELVPMEKSQVEQTTAPDPPKPKPQVELHVKPSLLANPKPESFVVDDEVFLPESKQEEELSSVKKLPSTSEITGRPVARNKKGTTGRRRGRPPKTVDAADLASVESVPNSPSIINEDPDLIKEYKTWKKAIMLMWNSAAIHRFANTFLHPVTEDEAPGYHSVIRRPMDLILIKKNIETGVVRTTMEVERDMLIMFQNAIMYNSSDHDVYNMSIQMQTEVLKEFQNFNATQMMIRNSEQKVLRNRKTEEEEGHKRKKRSSLSEEGSSKKRRSRMV